MENSFGPFIFYETSFGLKITETLVVSWIIIGILILSSYLLTRNLKKVPTGVQNILELLVGSVYSLVESTMGADHIYFAPYIGTLMLYIAAANLCGLTGFMRPPTADLNTTFGLALITFFMCHIKGVQSKGIKAYLKGFTEPFFLFIILSSLWKPCGWIDYYEFGLWCIIIPIIYSLWLECTNFTIRFSGNSPHVF